MLFSFLEIGNFCCSNKVGVYFLVVGWLPSTSPLRVYFVVFQDLVSETIIEAVGSRKCLVLFLTLGKIQRQVGIGGSRL